MELIRSCGIEGDVFASSTYNKPGEVGPRRVCLRNAFEPVYPLGG